MKIYFLVEGQSTELNIYPCWLGYLFPELTHYRKLDEFANAKNGLFMFSGNGYPSMLNHISNAVEEITDIGDVDHFFVALDTDDSTPEERREEIINQPAILQLPDHTKFTVFTQHCCFETMLLGNRRVIPRQPNASPLIEFMQFYNVVNEDPEQMGSLYDHLNRAQFHGRYLKEALLSRNIHYSKGRWQSVAEQAYFQELQSRIASTSHLASFAYFVETVQKIAQK